MNQSTRNYRIFGLLLGWMTLQCMAHADIIVKISIAEMAQRADKIVIGSVSSIQSQYDRGGSEIYTHIKISSVAYLKGNPDDIDVTVEVRGGQVDDKLSFISSSPDFEIGETVLVFLKSSSETHNDAFRVVGWAQGKFAIYRDELSGRYRVVRNFAGTALISIQQIVIPEFLDDLVSEIENSLP